MKEKVYFLIPNLGGGGVEKVITTLSHYLEKYEIHFVLLEDNIAYPYKGTVHILDIEINKKLGLFGKIKKFYNLYIKLKKFKKDNNVNLMMSFMPLSNILNILTKEKEKIIISIRADPSKQLDELGSYKYIYRLLIKKLYSKVNNVVVISNKIKKDLIDNFNIPSDTIRVIYNPIEIKKINKHKIESIEKYFYQSVFKNDVIINVGRLSVEKGQSNLIRVFSKLKKQLNDIKLVIIGQGPLKSDLIKLSETLRLRVFDLETMRNMDNLKEFDVYFLGFQSNPYNFIKHSKLFLLTSSYEGFGNVVTESMVCGTPVLSSCCNSGPGEIIAPDKSFAGEISKEYISKYGVLMPNFNAFIDDRIDLVWVDTIKKLLEDEHLRNCISTNAFSRVNDFSVEKIFPFYENEFINVL